MFEHIQHIILKLNSVGCSISLDKQGLAITESIELNYAIHLHVVNALFVSIHHQICEI